MENNSIYLDNGLTRNNTISLLEKHKDFTLIQGNISYNYDCSHLEELSDEQLTSIAFEYGIDDLSLEN